MKKTVSYISCLLSMFVLSGCDQGTNYKHPPFSTQYTVEEHIERISAITDELIVEVEG